MYMLPAVVLEGVSRTAVGVARVRAHESERDSRLFDDPWASAFAALGEPPSDEPPSPQRLALAFQIIIRTRFYDDWLRGETERDIRQFVLLGAGLDTRAFRLECPGGTTVWELDLPPVIEAKQQVLDGAGAVPTCSRVTVAADVTGDWLPRLEASGWDVEQPTAWLAEGLLVYLDRAQATHVITTVTSASAPSSGFATERTSGATTRLTAADTQAATSLWLGGLGDDLQPLLNDLGWTTQVHLLGEVAARLGRPMSRETQSGFITAIS
jgi:methyltransferase (TIGR00027 family)